MRIRSAFTVFFLSILVLFPIRVKTLSDGLDLSDNMFSGGKLAIIFSVVLILSILLILIISKKAINVPSYVRVKRSIPCTFSSIIMAAFVAYDSVLALGGKYSDIFVGNRYLLYGILGLFAAVAILLFAVSFLTGNPIASKVPIISLIPAIWACVRLTLMFMHYTTIADISTYYFDICYYITFLIFLFGQAKVFSSIETRKSVKLSVAFGLICCIFSALSVCTRFWINTVSSETFIESAIVPRFMDAFAIIYMLCYLFFVTKGEHKTHKREDIPLADYNINGTYNDFWNYNSSRPSVNRTDYNNVSNTNSMDYSTGEKSRGDFQPVYVVSSSDYFDEDDGSISLFPERKMVKAKKITAHRVKSVSNALSEVKTTSSAHPKAHIQDNLTVNSVPDYIETSDTVTQMPIMEEQIVNASPDEAIVYRSENKTFDRPRLGKGYAPKSTVKASGDGYCVYNCLDE